MLVHSYLLCSVSPGSVFLRVKQLCLRVVLPLGRKDIKLVSVKVAGKQLSSGQYQVTDKHLVIGNLPSGNFDVEIEVDIKPKENTSLEGLYNSSGTFCTQCEAEGFRGITYFYDRWVDTVSACPTFAMLH